VQRIIHNPCGQILLPCFGLNIDCIERRVIMLKNIPAIISPELMMVLMEMGHGDEIVLADANYPVESAGTLSVRADGHGIPELLEAILLFLPLDQYEAHNVFYMDTGKEAKPQIWQCYENIFKASKENYSIKTLERFQFYQRAAQGYAIVATGERSLYANIILKKGVIS
jgi:L-fucose mutarotase